MTPVARAATALSAAVLVLGLCSCGAPPPPGASTASTVAPVDTATPEVGDRGPHETENQAYRDRVPLAPGAQQHLDAERTDVLARFAALDGARTAGRVQAVLASAGLTSLVVGRDSAGGVVAFDAEADPYGCLSGTVPATGAATVDTAGFIADGGCHALTGH